MKYFATTIGILFLASTSIFGQCLNSSCCLDGTIWDNSLGGCVIALNGDFNEDLCIGTSDLLSFLSIFGTCLPGFNCGNSIDHDGYSYSTVQIGDQCWFSENCRYLPSVSPSSDVNGIDPNYYVYGYEGTDVAVAQSNPNYSTYGVLYNLPAVMTEGICPSGWHLPTNDEFTQLTDFLGGLSVAGIAMKSSSGWNDNGNGSNSSGFTGLPGGGKLANGFLNVGGYGYWWSADLQTSPEQGPYAYHRHVGYYFDYVISTIPAAHLGLSARCIQD
jgi:uncharacterized protein (TIGR02145 family)